jgi:hypothetical protein
MPHKHFETQSVGGPGASHENRAHPEKTKYRALHPADTTSPRNASTSGGGGETDTHHAHEPYDKGHGG